jgi:putative ABC transport system permease protein
VLFLGVIVGGPVLATVFASLARVVVRPFPGAALRVGVENVQRNPRRSATTALALVIGVFLVVLVTAGGGAIRDYVVGRLGELGGADVTVMAPDGVPPEYSRRLRATDGVESAADVYYDVGVVPVEGGGRRGGGEVPASGVDYADIGAVGLTATEGDLASLGPDDAVVPDFGPQNPGPALGEPITVTFHNGAERTLRVGARVQLAFPPTALVPAAVVRSAVPSAQPTQLSVKARSGKGQAVSDAATRLAREFAGIDVLPGLAFVQIIKGFFNLIITAVNGLLSVAVVVALFGIVNTLVLSVAERTREIGLLRAVGMTRRQLAASIRLEAVVVSLLGAAVGLVFGLFAAWCLTRPILNQEGQAATPFSWPVTQLGLILVLAVVVGVLASLVPAWRASRMSIIEAVTVE